MRFPQPPEFPGPARDEQGTRWRLPAPRKGATKSRNGAPPAHVGGPARLGVDDLPRQTFNAPLNRPPQWMVDIADLHELEHLAHRDESISGLLEPLDDIRQRFDRCELSAMQQHDLGCGRVASKWCWSCGTVSVRQSPPSSVQSTTEYPSRLRDLQRALRVAAMRRTHQRSRCRIVGERPEHVTSVKNLFAHFVAGLLIEVWMRIRVIADLVAFGLDASRYFRPLLRILTDQKKRRGNAQDRAARREASA